jgi:general stress protein YciG
MVNVSVVDEDLMENSEKPKRGFAAMDPERRRAIARLGGAAVPAEKRTFSKKRDVASAAGTRGGANVPAEKRTFSIMPELASSAGKKGNVASRNRRARKSHELSE